MAPSFSHRFAAFSEYTSFHGFRELSDSRQWFQKVFWAAIMIGSVAMLGVAVEKQVAQYVSGSTTTRVVRLTKEEPYIFPRVLVILAKWNWLDAEKIDRFGLTYEELQYAKSFYSPNMTINSPAKSLEAIERQLNHSFTRMNVSGVPEFFSVLALDTFDDQSNWTFRFKYVSPLGYCNYLLDLSGAKTQPFGHTRLSELNFDFSKYYGNARKVSKLFKNRSATSAGNTMDGAALYNEARGLRAEFYTFETNQDVLLAPNERLTITIDSKIYRRSRDCRHESDYNDEVCLTECEASTNTSFGQSCFEAGTGSDSTAFFTTNVRDGRARICRADIFFDGTLIAAEQPVWSDPMRSEEWQRALEECKKSCLPRCAYASTTWATQTTDLQVYLDQSGLQPATQVYQETESPNEDHRNSPTVRPSQENQLDNQAAAMKSLVEINFPDRSGLIVFEEVDQYDSIDMISDLGGLLGLWLGASMMSLFQIVHLCCWTEAKSADIASPLTRLTV